MLHNQLPYIPGNGLTILGFAFTLTGSPSLGKRFLVVVDAHSKCLEVKVVHNATTINTIEHLRSLFATHGLPEMIVIMGLFLQVLNSRIFVLRMALNM